MARRTDTAERICDLHVRGLINAHIARELGVSRPYVSQVLTGRGLSPAKNRAAWAEAKWGVSADRLAELRANGLQDAYRNQEAMARKRGIEWRFTLGTWLEVWEASGHLHERGPGVNGYCMARNGDIGPYAPGNVTIKTIPENTRESFLNPRRVSAIVGVTRPYPGTTRPWVARVLGRRLGRFASEQEAGAAVIAARRQGVAA